MRQSVELVEILKDHGKQCAKMEALKFTVDEVSSFCLRFDEFLL